jgi:superfamily I DNA/RNA helicase
MNAVLSSQPQARSWSPYQQRIFDFVEHGSGNAIIQAVAGSGKTTTIVEALKRVKGASIFLAFNKAIAEELKRRGVNARTFHSLTYGPVMRHKGASNVNQTKLRDIVDARCSGEDAEAYGSFITRLVGLGRQAGIGCLIPDTAEAWLQLAEYHDLEPDSDLPGVTIERGVELASRLLQAAYESAEVDFDDMLYLAVRDGLALPHFDFVFVDEAQDTNNIQRAILRKIMREDSRLVAVGDSAQAIYGFRGADSNSMGMIAEEFGCETLPLSVSYRCPQAVVQYAAQWCQQIEAAPGAAQGSVEALQKWDARTFRPTDLVVCRTTKPLVALAYSMLKAGVGVRVMGREIGQGLIALINRMRARGLDQLQEKLRAYTEREVQKAIARKKDAKAAALQDKTDTVLCLIDGLDERSRTIPALIAAVERLFSDAAGVTTLATIHKAKGLEAKRVLWLNRSECPSRWARQDWQQQQERNLCYVAATRALEELVLIEVPKAA